MERRQNLFQEDYKISLFFFLVDLPPLVFKNILLISSAKDSIACIYILFLFFSFSLFFQKELIIFFS